MLTFVLEIVDQDFVSMALLQAALEQVIGISNVSEASFLGSLPNREISNKDVIVMYWNVLAAVSWPLSRSNPVQGHDGFLTSACSEILLKLITIAGVAPSCNIPILVHVHVEVCERLLEGPFGHPHLTVLGRIEFKLSFDVRIIIPSTVSIAPGSLVSLFSPWVSHMHEPPSSSCVISDF